MKLKKLNSNSNKKGLLTPTDILSIVLFTATLAFAWFFYSFNYGGEEYGNSNTYLYANELSQSFNTIQVDESKHNSIKSQCRGLLATQIEEYYFLKKHCINAQRQSNQFSISFTAGLMDSMKKKFEDSNSYMNYVSIVKESKPNCREFFQIDSLGNDVERVIADNILTGNAIFKTPIGYYSACSSFTPRRS